MTTRAPVWSLFTGAERARYLAILFLVSTSNYVDKNVISVLLEPIKHEFHVSDTALGLLSGVSFALLYATLGLPVARLADRGNRQRIITLALVVWSAFTALCGVAQTFVQLALARFGVGAGEAGAIPPAQSLIADYFPPEQRARALSIFIASALAGYLIGFVGGTQIAAAHGWRAAFLVMGLPGLALALLSATLLSEPRRLSAYAVPEDGRETLGETARALLAKRSFVALLVAMTFYFLYAYGAMTFVPSYIVRALHVPLKTVGLDYGAVTAISGVIGTVAGGALTDRLAACDVRWLVRLPALSMIAMVPLNESALIIPDFRTYLALSFMTGLMLGGAVPAMFAAIHHVCGAPRRALAIAIIFFFANLFGLGLGPVMTGAISDRFAASFGAASLRPALMIMTLALLPAAWFLRGAARTLTTDHEA